MNKKHFFLAFATLLLMVLMYNSCEKEEDDNRLIFNYGSITDIDGNEYKTISIGEQDWMAENLQTTTYKDGTPIDLISNNDDFSNSGMGAYCWYDNNKSQYAESYGALYNWYAVNTGKLCPDGWHVPTDDEWKIVELTLGMSQLELDNINWRGSNEGSKLAGNNELWSDNILVRDNEFGTTGFQAHPGGYRYSDENFYAIGSLGYWWSTSKLDDYNVMVRGLSFQYSNVYRGSHSIEDGFSVRCLRD